MPINRQEIKVPDGRDPPCFRRRLPTVLAQILALLLASPLLGTSQASPGAPRESPQEVEAGAEQQAEQMVSLSAKTIEQILLREPGLLLEVKKALVRKAYQQGRLLAPADLSDDTLFQLLREDNNVRILATRELASRLYVRAKPNAGELRQSRTLPARAPSQPAAGTEMNAVLGAQENAYWAAHELVQPHEQTGEPSPEETDPSPEPEIAPGRVPPSRLPQNFAATPDLNSPELLPTDAGSLPRVTPAELPELLSASLAAPADPNALRPRAYGDSWPMRPNSAPGSSVIDQPPSGRSVYDSRPRQPERSTWGRPAAPTYAQPAIRHQPNPYADIPSLYDLYQQVSSHPPVPQRFGMDVFRNGTGNSDELPMDTPAGPDYVLGPGDGLSIAIWGSVSGQMQRVVDRQGVLALPEAGSVQVAGKTLGEVQRLVQSALRTQYRDAEADISLARLRTVRVYVVGDVLRPGAYDVSALSTALNGLYLAGGPTPRGSLRVLRHRRGNQLLETIDVYDLLLHGVRSGTQRLEAGDTIQVPPLGPEVTVEGMVRRPAIYELNGETTLAEVLEIAGGVLTSGTLRHIEIERVLAHQNRTMLRVDLPEGNDQLAATRTLADFPVQDGDKIRVSPILPFSEKTVYLDGHVFHPGKYAYREGMRLGDLLHSYNEVLPEPALGHAEIIRLNPPDYSPAVLAFNLADAMAGATPVALQPFDTVRIFGRFDFEPPPLISVSGEVRHPGDHLTNGQTSLRDAVYLAGGATPDALLSDAQLFRRTQDGKMHVISVNLERALAGDARDNIPLEPMDRLFIHKNLGKADPPTVKIEGPVAQPGTYPLGENMTAAELVRLAGGLKRGAFTDTADLTRYDLIQGPNVVGEHHTLALARALSGEPDTDLRLRDGDVLTIRELAGWHDVGATIAVSGEVQHPGTYGIQEGERLSSILKRAGGFRADAYPFLMTIPEAVCLLIQAGTLAHRGEIFVLDMGTPVRIQKLAEDLIELSGLRPDKDVRIEITRMNPGEKITEVLVDKACEKLRPTGHDKIQVIHTRSFDAGEFATKIRFLERAARTGDVELVYHSLAALNIGFVCKDTRLPWPRTLQPASSSTPVPVSLSPTLDA